MIKIHRQLRPVSWIRFYSSITNYAKRYIEITEDDFIKELQKPLLDNLTERGLIEQVTDREKLALQLQNGRVSLYCGADPTAISLHLGNLLPLMVLVHFNLKGHNVFGLVGGATGAVGDPSGKTKLRDKLEDDTRLRNVLRIEWQLQNFLQNGVNIANSKNESVKHSNGQIKTVNNYTWWQDIKLIEFLARYGSHIRISSMLARDSVKSRLDSPLGLGFNEFTYQILQLFDFYHLFSNESVQVQVGGNDQYGNITAGIDLISRIDKSEKSAFGLTVPLLTTSTGEKFGKSAGNAIFIDEKLTTPFQLFQFMYNSSDDDVKPFLYKYSFLPLSVIDKLIEVHNGDKKQRLGQKVLAMEMCDLIHGDGVGYNNLIISEFLYQGKSQIPLHEILRAFNEQKMLLKMTRDEISQLSIIDLLVKLDLGQSSKSKWKRLITSRSVQVGLDGFRISSLDEKIPQQYLIQDKLLFLRIGKTDHFVIEIN